MTAAARYRLLVVLSISVVVIAGALIWFLWPVDPGPPVLALEGVDASVVAALTDARAAVTAQPRSPKAWGELGELLFANDFHTEGLVCLRRAEQLDPTEARWPYFQGLILLLRQPEAAAAPLERAARLRPRDLTLQLRLAEVLLYHNELDQADARFKVVLELVPDHPRGLLGRGQIAQQRGEWKECVPLLEQAATSPFAARTAHAALAVAYQRLGNAKAVDRHRRAADEAAPDVPWADHYLDAIQSLRVSLFARLDRADLLIAQQAIGPAVQLLEEIVADHPESDEARLKLAQALIRAGNNQRAEKELLRLTTDHPRVPEGWLLLGMLFWQRGNRAEADDPFRRAIELRPDYALAHLDRGRCLHESGKLGPARECYQSALRYRPQYVLAHVCLARLLREQGEKGPARDHLRQAIQLQPTDAEALRLLNEERKHWPDEK